MWMNSVSCKTLWVLGLTMMVAVLPGCMSVSGGTTTPPADDMVGNDDMAGNDDVGGSDDVAGNDDVGGPDDAGNPTEVERLAFSAEAGFSVISAFVLATGDFNQDGFADVVTAAATNPDKGTIYLLANDGSGAFPLEAIISGGNDVLDVAQIKSADLDGDGDLDLVVADSGDHDGDTVLTAGGIWVFVNDGGTFTSQGGLISVSTDRPTEVEIGDVNNDGTLDLLVMDSEVDTDQLDILLGAGGARFGTPSTMDLPANSSDIALADMDADGNLDIILSLTSDSSGTGLNQAAVLYGAGDASFGSQLTVDTVLAPRLVDSADINGDGDLDLVIGDSFGTVNIFLANGDRSFDTLLTIEDAPGNIFEIVDMDGDGNLDIVSKSVASDPPVILYGDGTGAFKEIQNFGFDPMGGVVEFDVIDLNNDGLPDIVTVGALLVVSGTTVTNTTVNVILQTATGGQ